jgi:hypothetical protein
LLDKRFTILSALCLAAYVSVPLRAAEAPSDRAALTQGVIELQRDLLLTRQKYLVEENRALAIYLAFDNVPKTRPDSISVSLDDKLLAEEKLNPLEIDRLDKGGMKKLVTRYLPPGEYLLKVTLKTGNSQVSKTLPLTKSDARDNVRITITTFLQQHTPEITFAQETWTASK